MSVSRTLIAFAYVADQFSKSNDIAAGLLPLFAPLISARAGTSFNSGQFAADVRHAYDLDMHPYVADELAPALAKAGFLTESRMGVHAVHYTNNKCILPEPPFREDQLRKLVDSFCSFAIDHFSKAGISVENNELESALLDRLIRPEFLALILRPDSVYRSSKTLGLTKQQEIFDSPQAHHERHLDFLVARFILQIYESNSEQFDFLVSATSGCLVAEVVLDLRSPPVRGEPLSNLRFAIDSPLILDALELGLDGAAPYAKKLIEQIRQTGARPIVFDCTIEEIQGALRSPLQHYERGQDLYGPLGRKLRNSTAFAAYLRAVIPDVQHLIADLGVEVITISPVERAQRLRFFTEPNESKLAGHLGDYPTDEARLHDARAIADVLRIRSQRKVSSIKDAEIIFVTRNARLARLSRKFLIEESLSSDDYFPPCITDRYLAGIMWILSGGGGGALSRLRLVANCSAATVPRRDIVSRMHRFFEESNPNMVARFEALMTNERAEYFLMERTLGDVTLITPENYEEIYRDIEEVAAERVTEKKNMEIAALQKEYAEKLEKLTSQLQAEAASYGERLNEESSRAFEIQRRAEDEAAQARVLRHENKMISETLAEREQSSANACMRSGIRAQRLAWAMIVASEALISVLIGQVSTETTLGTVLVSVLVFLLSLVGSALGSGYYPGNPLDKWIKRRRDAAVQKYAKVHDLDFVLKKFVFEWDIGVAKERALELVE